MSSFHEVKLELFFICNGEVLKGLRAIEMYQMHRNIF